MRNDMNRRWLLNSRPIGPLEPDTFKWDEVPIPPVAEGEFLVRNLWLSFDPAQRGWINDVPSYVPPVQLGEPMRPEAASIMQGWIAEKKLVWQIDVASGLENAPRTLAGLFAGANFGKQLLKIADPPLS